MSLPSPCHRSSNSLVAKSSISTIQLSRTFTGPFVPVSLANVMWAVLSGNSLTCSISNFLSQRTIFLVTTIPYLLWRCPHTTTAVTPIIANPTPTHITTLQTTPFARAWILLARSRRRLRVLRYHAPQTLSWIHLTFQIPKCSTTMHLLRLHPQSGQKSRSHRHWTCFGLSHFLFLNQVHVYNHLRHHASHTIVIRFSLSTQ
jgi:hypothetical protein